MTRTSRLAAAAALLGGLAAAGAAAAQDPMHGMMGDMGGPEGLDFAAIDSDGNGALSRAELQARAAARLGAADTNGDGMLERVEIVAAVPGYRGALVHVFAADPAEGYADRLLALVGGTETGRVEVTVLADRRVNQLLAIADTDRDAAISQEEADALAAHGHGRGDGPRRHGPGPGRGDGDGPRGAGD